MTAAFRKNFLTRRYRPDHYRAPLVNTQNLSPILLRSQSAPAAQSWPALILVFLFAIALMFATPLAAQNVDDHNPIGVTGAIEGTISTGCAHVMSEAQHIVLLFPGNARWTPCFFDFIAAPILTTIAWAPTP